MNTDTVVVVQARNGSSRLPFKSIMSLGGQPVILHVVYRLLSVIANKYPLVVATSTNEEDDLIFNLLKAHHIQCFRGDPSNVLSRFQDLSKYFNPINIIRVTGDCPLLYPSLILDLISNLDSNPKLDYISNTLSRTYPHGFDVEGFRSSLISELYSPLHDDKSQEHVTPFIYNNSFRCESLLDPNGDNLSNIRLTLDYPEDLCFMDKLIWSYMSSSSSNTVFDCINGKEIQALLNANDLNLLHQKCIAAAAC